MISIGSNGQKIAYGVKHYNLDTEADLAKLPTRGEKMGCTCFVISTSKYYMLDSKFKWVEITPFGKVVSSGSGSGSDTDIDQDGIPDSIDPSIDIEYEGGRI
jgi:hypothetical protein